MICPRCKKNTAYILPTDIITKPGKIYNIEVLCDGECMNTTEQFCEEFNSPEVVATVTIQVSIKRGSLKLV